MDGSKKHSRRNPKETANPINRLFFWWTIKLFWKGSRKHLEETDLYDPLLTDESENLGNQLEREWNEELEKMKTEEFTLGKDGMKKKMNERKPSLLRAILRAFWSTYMVSGLRLFLITVIFQTLIPISQMLVIGYFNKSGVDAATTKNQALMYAGVLVVSNACIVFLYHHNTLSCLQIGMRIRIACCSLVYRKVLRISKTALGQTGAGQVINLMSNDVHRFDLALMFLHCIWIMPIQVLSMGYIMWHMVGAAVFVGIGTSLLLNVCVQSYLSRTGFRLRSAIAKKTDTRVQLMNELIAGIQMIKMYAWEKSFNALVSRVRALEMKLIGRSTFLNSLHLSFVIITDKITLYLTLITFVLMGNTLTAQISFVIATFFNAFRLMVVVYFPNAINKAGEALISIRRLEKFLLLEEKGELKTEAEKGKQESESHGNCAVTIKMHRVSANWVLRQLPPTLFDISLNVEAGKLCAVVGPVGAGKSSLLHLLLNELPAGAGKISFHLESGTDRTELPISYSNVRFSYSSQNPWLFTATLRENILFGEPYDEERYQEVTRVCALLKDFKHLPQGDLSIVGERGVTLSGGQRVRVNLARAVYKQADVYLLDDPLSAVDTRVGCHLFEECVNGYLKDKTRILVTHQLQYLKDADNIVVLDSGAVRDQGSFDELSKSNAMFTELLESIKEGKVVDEKQDRELLIDCERKETESPLKRRFIRQASSASSTSSILTGDAKEQRGNSVTDESRWVSVKKGEAEQVATGRLSSKVYGAYFRAGSNVFRLILIGLVIIMGQIANSSSDYWVAYWTNTEAIRLKIQSNSTSYNHAPTGITTIFQYFNLLDEDGLLPTVTSIYVYTFCLLATILLVTSRGALFMNVCVAASNSLHNTMFANITQATMRFFNVNPSGRILNRFSKDMGTLDEMLPQTMMEVLQTFLVLTGIFSLEIVLNYWMLIPTALILMSYYMIRNYYLSTAQGIKRLEGIMRSPVFSHVNATLHGLTTIRSRGKRMEEMLFKEFDRYQDTHTGAWYLTIATSCAFTFAIDTVSCCFITCVCFFMILNASGDTFGGDAGLAISQSLVLTGLVQFGMRKSAETILHMIAVERVLQYTNLPKEGPLTTPNPPGPSWPSSGQLSFKNVYMKYSDDGPHVLKDVNVDIKSGWKVGIVGRTGTGKSSLVAALFRLTGSGLEGEIKIDGRDTGSIGLHELRTCISIIPQEPVLFSASLRYNLDPFECYSDSVLWEVLREVELGHIATTLDYPVARGGSNLSVGERQLVCLARAILRNNRILVIDEATANIDHKSDALIQKTLRQRFADCTVLTIAHRLNTIIDCDRILVMDTGRMVEFGHPHLLLRDAPQGHFARLVEQTGEVMASRLAESAEIAYLENPEFTSTSL